VRDVTLIHASLGRRRDGTFVKSWLQEPLSMAILAALTPPEWQSTFFDDRHDTIDYDRATDLVAISIETYSARRGYEIAERFRRRRVPVVFGGYHATLVPNEAQKHADAVCIGEAESVWASILDDAAAGRLKARYHGGADLSRQVLPDRRLFRGRPYLPLSLVETGRGCPNRCDFCSISAYFGATYRRRPIAHILEDLETAPHRDVFFVDDNLTGDRASALELFDAVKPLKRRWMTQTSLCALDDRTFVRAMADGGCIGVLVGFESLDEENIRSMGKGVNRTAGYRQALANLRDAGIFVYGTFVFGYPNDTPALVDRTVGFAIEERMLIAAFNHLMPFPGTPLYRACEAAKTLTHDRWWLTDGFAFGQVPFAPAGMSATETERSCLAARRRFYSLGSILRRSFDFRCNLASAKRAALYVSINSMMRREVSQKRDIPLGHRASPLATAPGREA
jgi:radical SAM superfamily enzyme YgiQ (UPF0313 family)